MPPEPGQQPRPGQDARRAFVPTGEPAGGVRVGGQRVVGSVGGLEGAGPGHHHLGHDRVGRGQVHDRAEGRGRLGGTALALERMPQAGQGADPERGFDGGGRLPVRSRCGGRDGSGYQVELLDGAVKLAGGQGGLGDPEPGAAAGPCRRGTGEPGVASVLPASVGAARAELGGDQVGQGELGDLAARVLGQVAFQRRDRLGVSAGLDVCLAQEELRVGGQRPGRLGGQASRAACSASAIRPRAR